MSLENLLLDIPPYTQCKSKAEYIIFTANYYKIPYEKAFEPYIEQSKKNGTLEELKEELLSFGFSNDDVNRFCNSVDNNSKNEHYDKHINDVLSEYFEEKLSEEKPKYNKLCDIYSSVKKLENPRKFVYGQLYARYFQKKFDNNPDFNTIFLESYSSYLYSWTPYLKEFIEHEYLYDFEIININSNRSILKCIFNSRNLPLEYDEYTDWISRGIKIGCWKNYFALTKAGINILKTIGFTI